MIVPDILSRSALALAGAGVGLGLVFGIFGLVGSAVEPEGDGGSSTSSREVGRGLRAASVGRAHHATRQARTRRAVTAVLAGTIALLVTRWPISFLLAGSLALGLRGLGGGPAKPVIAKLEAIASWTEMLRDTLAGAAGLGQALTATGGIAPLAIRGPVRALAAGLASGTPLPASLLRFAEEVDDAAADVVVASLLMAATERAQRLGDLLGALAISTREEIAMRQRVEAARASARSAVRTVTGFSVGLFALMAAFAHRYLAPYSSVSGQVVLGVVGVVFGLGLWLMSAMIRPRPVARLFAEARS